MGLAARWGRYSSLHCPPCQQCVRVSARKLGGDLVCALSVLCAEKNVLLPRVLAALVH